MNNEIKCMFPDCDRESKTRGLCRNHYSIANKLVKSSIVDWKTLENAGKCLPVDCQQKNPKQSDWFMEALKNG